MKKKHVVLCILGGFIVSVSLWRMWDISQNPQRLNQSIPVETSTGSDTIDGYEISEGETSSGIKTDETNPPSISESNESVPETHNKKPIESSPAKNDVGQKPIDENETDIIVDVEEREDSDPITPDEDEKPSIVEPAETPANENEDDSNGTDLGENELPPL